jgi:hypothetical protein
MVKATGDQWATLIVKIMPPLWLACPTCYSQGITNCGRMGLVCLWGFWALIRALGSGGLETTDSETAIKTPRHRLRTGAARHRNSLP